MQWIVAIALAAAIPIAIIGSFGMPHQLQEPLYLTEVEVGDIVWLKTSSSWLEQCRSILSWPDYSQPIEADLIATLKRGDVVAYIGAPSDSSHAESLLLGRIAGLPGDTLKIQNGNIYVNGERLKQVHAVHLFTASFADSLTAITCLSFPDINVHALPRKNKRVFEVSFSATEKRALAIAGDSATLAFSKMVKTTDRGSLFPNGHDHQTGYFYGPLAIPRAGDSLLAKSPAYHHHLYQAQEDSSSRGQAVFTNAYFFLVNDFRMETDDSRQHGALPANRIRGVVAGLAWQPTETEP